MKKHKHKFLNLPSIVGGKTALDKYIKENLVYPEEALKNRTEGIVELNAEIDDNGNVIQVDVVKGLSGGCDEEAIRLIKNVRFGAVKNKGLRVKTKKRFKVKFQLPPQSTITYEYVEKKRETENRKPDSGFTYTINIS